MIRTLTLAAIFTLTAAAVQARDTTVLFGDLDIGTPGGAQALEARIHDAATNVCAIDKPHAGTIALYYQTLEKDCLGYVSKHALTKIQALVSEHRALARQFPGLLPERQAQLTVGR